METPFFGTAYTSRSTNLANQQLINLFPEIVETKSGKRVGAFFGCPGLDLFTTVGTGPINGTYLLFNGLLYVVSGSNLYSVTAGAVMTFLGALAGVIGPVSMQDNGVHLAIFTATSAYVVGPASARPLTGGTIGVGGSGYAVNDTILLSAVGGSFVATPILTVTSVAAGAVTGFSISQAGAFSANPSSFVQQSTSGSGVGFTLVSPTFGPLSGAPILIPLPFTPDGSTTISACQMDGFIVINQVPGSYLLWQSNELDASIWNPLFFASASGDTDSIVALIQQHREIFVIKQYSTQIFVNAGLPNFVFQNLTDVFIEIGTVAPQSVAALGETWFCLYQNRQGSAVVLQMRGYTPTPVSTHAISHAIEQQGIAAMQAAVAFTYTQEQHAFYVLNVGNQTWVYDATESGMAGFPVWHQRASFAGGVFNRHVANNHVFAFGLHLVGDYQSGNIYSLDLNTLTDNGAQRKWLRSWRALPQPSMDPVRFSELTIDMQTGIGVVTVNPQVELRWTDDGGHNYSSLIMTAAGNPGQTALRVKFNALGSTKRETGLDRIFEVSSADMFPAALIGADLR